MSRWVNTVACIFSYTLNALLLIGFLYVATTVVDDEPHDILRYEHTLYRYIVETEEQLSISL